ncbi:MAG: hypothetical protein ACRBB4_01585 [Neptuniibacter sp.]
MGDNTQGTDPQLLMLLGEIKGELGGIRAQIVESNAATNRRIDDLSEFVKQQTEAVNRRIDDHQQDVDQRFNESNARIKAVEDEQRTSKRITIVTSGGVAAMATGLVEAIKALN